MKKPRLILTIMVLLLIAMITLPGCQKTKYCGIENCPAETVKKSSYCAKHKCKNSNCDAPNIGALEKISVYSIDEYYYCRNCLSR